ncbi:MULTISPECIES: putative metalloprotease CJM1_0395 family protein [unclassified Paludibacterium]|uniref:putative metalloprotease CJM1_0395 family protein n=1 Tax=unclassified Paludibacterium TaxID=2618429 RepID=UPI001C040926|nr:putative metalloprotease CJM1_0395 family protein [Paludibacterium sp. B53371]BEV73691.1 hypothetical protein THUN1379_31730 [Paludibacterium sp. THUN1379]
MSISSISASSYSGFPAPTGSNGQPLTPAQQKQVADLQAADRDVRAHEQAHMAAAGGLATGGASFTYQTGPDGKQYAIAGEVPIAISTGSSPQQTIALARQMEKAALAPADPSPQDRKVAASAQQMIARAEAQLREQQMQKQQAGSPDQAASPTYSASGTTESATATSGSLINTYA